MILRIIYNKKLSGITREKRGFQVDRGYVIPDNLNKKLIIQSKYRHNDISRYQLKYLTINQRRCC